MQPAEVNQHRRTDAPRATAQTTSTQPITPRAILLGAGLASLSLYRLWFPIFVIWLVKSMLLRYGGLRSYHRALPFFLGLVLGEFAAGFLRSLGDLGLGLYLPVGSGLGGL
jgi:hypothetical protein